MSIKIEIIGENALEETAHLKNWLESARISGVETVEQEEIPPDSDKGEMGPTLLAVLTVVLGSAAMVKLAESVHVWISAKYDPIIVKFTNGDEEVLLKAQNPEDLETVVAAINRLRV
ncbi:effector-associated constant component EACC1 [Roseibium sp. Sym1]|uniref:effector-associated constant component EACC1 n=1 Tax=Roseibium sp. Sym1 TaxID=3016006 RepID=UPI0022B33C4E|nr:hypothetical protein [Roseibium sp. Sym1]